MVAERGADVTVGAALRWLDGVDGDSALFLWVHLFDPHAPYAPPAPWAARFADRPYDGEIAFADSELARLLAHPRLARAASADALLVMAIADHGESLGEHGESSHGMLLYESTVRVPWIVAGPGVRPGVRVAEPVSQTDLFPTALALLGVEDGPTPIDGANLAERLRNVRPESADGSGSPGREGDRMVYAETRVPLYAYGWSALRALIAGRFKLIEAPAPELYDVVADGPEARDLYRTERARASTLEQTMATRFGTSDQPPRESRAAPDPASDAALRTLGYVAGRTVSRRTGPPPDPKAMMDVHRGVERGEGLLHARDFVGAQRELRAVLDRDPENIAALEDTATALAELGRFDSAEGALKRALALAPDRASLQLAMAQIEGARGDWRAALTRAEAASALTPEDAAVLAMRAQALDRLGRAADARAAIDRALAIAPDDPLLAVRYVEIVELPGRRYQDADQRLLRAVAEQPYLATAWRMLGRVREAAGRPADARAAYLDGLAYQPRDGTLHAALGLLLAESDGAAARSHLEQAVELMAMPAPEVRNALGDVLAARGETAAAAGQWTLVVRATESATAVEDRHQRAIALRSLGRREDAEAVWRELVAAGPDHAPAWQGLAAAALDRKAWNDAAAAARRAADIDPALATAWNILAIATEEIDGKAGGGAALSARGGRPADLLAGEPQSRSGAARSGPLRRGGAGLRGRARDRSRARQVALRARSALRRRSGDAAGARDHLEQALRLDPASPRAADARAALAVLPPQNRKPTEKR